MIVLRGGDVVLHDRVVAEGALFIDGDRIAAVRSSAGNTAGHTTMDVSGCLVVPGFIDVHTHGLHGHDVLEGGEAVVRIAEGLPRYGVTAFCPTTIACGPDALRRALRQVRLARASPGQGRARVLPAHLESNFINPDYAGAQPAACLRWPSGPHPSGSFSGQDILDVIVECRTDVGIVTLAPELPGGLDLVRVLVAAGHYVSLGHSGAGFEVALDAIEAGARQATHLFNRMPPVSHRTPGLVGAILSREEVTAELICDGVHVHPAVCHMAIATKGPRGVMAITDATAVAGLPHGASATLGGQSISARDGVAVLTDGTRAGSALTMDRAFATLVTRCGASVVDAATMCSTTPARAVGLSGFGVLAEGAGADVVVLDEAFRVVHTFIGGRHVYGPGS